AVAVLGDDEQVCVVGGDRDGDHLVVAAELHALHAGRVPPHCAHVGFGEADRLPELGHDQHVVLAARVTDADELVALAHLDRDDPVGAQVRVVGLQLGLLDHAVLRGEQQVLRLLEVARLDDRAHRFALAERQQVDDRAALRLARAERQLVHLEPVDLPDAREEQDVVVRRGDEQMLDVVLVLQVHPHHADAAAPLLAIRGDREALDVAGAGDRDHHVLFRDQVFELELLLGGDDLGAAVVAAAVDALQLEQLLLDQRVDLLLGTEQVAELLDALLLVAVVLLDARALERSEGAQAQLEDRRRLAFAQIELLHQAVARGLRVGRAADQGNDRVEIVERDQVALEDVDLALETAQLVLAAARDDLALEVEVVREQLEQRQRLRHAVDERDGVHTERRLQRRVLEQLVERDLRNRIALQLDLDAHAGAVRVILQVGDLGEHLLVDELGDLRDDARVAALLHAVRKLGDDDRALAAAELLDVSARTHDHAAAARAVRVPDARAADDD